VLVAGLLLVGLVAAGDGLFAAAGDALRRVCPHPLLLFCGLAALIVVVSAVLNLDTAVAFLTPVALSAGRSEGVSSEHPVSEALLPACILLSNAGSLLLPGSNLTNLIVVTHSGVSASVFVERMALAWVAAGFITAAVIAVSCRGVLARPRLGRPRLATSRPATPRPLSADDLVASESPSPPKTKAVLGIGAIATTAAVVAMLVITSPSLVVAGIGIVAATVKVISGELAIKRVAQVLNVAVLVGLMGLAVGVGTLGRLWSGPSTLLGHLDPLGTAAVAAVFAVAINNLPAASLLSARGVTHPLALLVGLDVGPNLFVSGSLSWVLWISSAHACGVDPGVRRAVRIGLVAAPLATLASVAALMAVSGGG
jgi:arsenical pump membrane protein